PRSEQSRGDLRRAEAPARNVDGECLLARGEIARRKGRTRLLERGGAVLGIGLAGPDEHLAHHAAIPFSETFEDLPGFAAEAGRRGSFGIGSRQAGRQVVLVDDADEEARDGGIGAGGIWAEGDFHGLSGKAMARRGQWAARADNPAGPLAPRPQEGTPVPPAGPGPNAQGDRQVAFEASQVDYNSDDEVVTASGDVILRSEDQSVRSDSITWNRKTGQIVAN